MPPRSLAHPLLCSFSSGRVELYDFGDADGDAPNDLLFESQNVAAAHPDVVANLSAPLLAWRATLPTGPVTAHAGCAGFRWPAHATVPASTTLALGEVEDDPLEHL